MSDSYQANLDVLKKTRPDFVKLIENTKDLPALSLFDDKGEANLNLNFNDGSKQPYYPTPPQEFSKNLISQLNLKNPRILIFLGFGLGLHIKTYLQHPHPANQGVVILEPNIHIFKKALQTQNLTKLLSNPKIFWFVGNNLELLKKFFGGFFNKINWLRYANAVEYVPLPPALKINAKFFKEAQVIVSQAIGHQYNQYFSDPYDGYRGLVNILDNLPRLIKMPHLDQAKNHFKNKPGVVIASGPSLDETLPFLKEIQNKAVLVACPSALSTLIKHGIHPHIWVHTERDKEHSQIFEPLSKNSNHIFIAPPLVHPDCFKLNGGINVYMLSAVLSDWLPLDGDIITYGHSSAHAGFSILNKIGCSQIYLIGQDLSYNDNSSHAQGTWGESVRMMSQIKETNHKIYEVQGNNDKNVKLNMFWHTYLKTFTENLIPNFNGKVYNVISKDKGAKIFGTQRLDPNMLFDSIENKDFEPFKKLAQIFSAPDIETVKKRQQMANQKIEEAILVLDQNTKDNEAFAINAKSFLFSYDISTKDWNKAKGPYENFMSKTETFLSRFYNNPKYQKGRDHYEKLFFVIVQGLMLRYFIDYFTSCTDINGDFNEINRKIEILFHSAKDQAFWSNQVKKLLHAHYRMDD